MMHFEKQPPQRLDAVNQKLLSQTPLHYACYRGDVDMVESLLGRTLSYNVDETAARSCISAMIEEEDTINGWTAAHWAACYGQLTCLMKLHVLPSVGFDKSSERSSTSPLHLAAQTGAILCLKWLLQCGAAINRQDFMGETALHKAAKAGNTDSAAMLVSHGSALELRNHRGSTPADLADLANQPTLAHFLWRCKAEQGPSLPHNPGTALPISDLHTTSMSSSLPHPSVTLHSPFIIPPSFPHHCKLTGESNNNDSSCVGMEAEDSYDMHRHDNELVSSESLSSGSGSSQTCSEEGLGLPGMKRSLDDDDDDVDAMRDSMDVMAYPNSKRRCFVSTQTEIEADKYGSACNNNIISSYNAVLAMRCEPLHLEPDPPTIQSSSAQEHVASVMAEHGYDRSLLQNVFM